MKAEKRCPHCGVTKAAAEFFFHENRVVHVLQSGPKEYRYPRLSSWCKECLGQYATDYGRKNPYSRAVSKRKWEEANPEKHREQKRRTALRRYGLTVSDYEDMLVAQDGTCASCGAGPGSRPLGVDHDHSDGRIRGLLCNACNASLGHLRDDPDRIMALLDYLMLGPLHERQAPSEDFPH